MSTNRRKPSAKKQQSAPAPTPEETPAQDLAFVRDEPEVTAPLAIVEPEPEAPEHVRALARVVRQHIGKQRHTFEAAQGVSLMYGYNGLSHVVHGHTTTHIATRDEIAAMSDQQIYDRVMAGGQSYGGRR